MCIHYKTDGDGWNEPVSSYCAKEHQWCDHSRHIDLDPAKGTVRCYWCKGNGMRWVTNNGIARLQRCWMCGSKGRLIAGCWCDQCEELYPHRYEDDDFPHHGCDEGCPDYSAPLEPDWDSMRGGHDDY